MILVISIANLGGGLYLGGHLRPIVENFNEEYPKRITDSFLTAIILSYHAR